MAGIYLHIPFCKQKCTYCDFHFSTTFSKYRQKMIEAFLKEIETRKDYLLKEEIETIYFGGGTPSLLTKEELEALTQAIKDNYSLHPDLEFTLEANPDDIDEAQLIAWKNIGVNRLSIGVQSFFDEDLKWMNRAHSSEEGVRAIQLAKQYDFLLTTDLIYGLPNHNLEKLNYNINKIIELSPQHISAYCLTVEKSTALDKMIQKKMLPLVGEDQQAEEFEFLVKQLKANGYQQYEISNFAKDNAYSKHNSNYWKGIEYIGIGPSAHSFNTTSRSWNIANNPLYIKGVLENETYREEEILSPKDLFNEAILTGLRTIWGVDLKKAYLKNPPPDSFFQQMEFFKKNKLVIEKDNVLLLTDKGKLQADYIASMLFVE